MVKRISILFIAVCALVLFSGRFMLGEDATPPPRNEAPEKKPGQQAPDKPGDEAPKLDALETFKKAVAWQGKPEELGILIDLEIDRLDFKIWGENEVEGHFALKYTAPTRDEKPKVWFKVWTDAWWRNYWTNGGAYFFKKGSGTEILSETEKEDAPSIEMIMEAVRVARLIVLENHTTENAKWTYIGTSKPRGKKGAPMCHLIKRQADEKDPKGTMWFYLDEKDFSPRCIALFHLLNAEGLFFIHLFEFKAFKGVRFPTHIEIYIESERNRFEKFLFADVIENAEKGQRLRINPGIDPEIYEFDRDD